MTARAKSGWGGRRPGAGRKPGRKNRSKEEIAKAKALRAAETAAKLAAEAHCQRNPPDDGQNPAPTAETAANRPPGGENPPKSAAGRENPPSQGPSQRKPPETGQVTILPPLFDVPIPADVEPLDFLKHLMRNDTLPLGFRRDCAALALPFAHAKPPMMGLKEQRYRDAFDDDDDDPIARNFAN